MIKKKGGVWALFAAGVCMVAAIFLFVREVERKEPIKERMTQIKAALGEDWTKLSETRIVPLVFKHDNGDTIVYYVISTIYENEAPPSTGLDPALEQIVDTDAAVGSRWCKVSGRDAVIYEVGNRAYLCWRISEQYTSVIEYSPNNVREFDVIRMAESVPANNAE